MLSTLFAGEPVLVGPSLEGHDLAFLGPPRAAAPGVVRHGVVTLAEGRVTSSANWSSAASRLSFSAAAGFCAAIGAAGTQRRRRARCSAGAPDAVLDAIESAPKDLREQRLATRDRLRSLGLPWPTPQNDRLLRAARGEEVDRPPKWMMRQAGRYLPEYMSVLERSDFFSVCRDPKLAAEVTLQPYRRYPTLDSLIIFSDILVIPVAMGMPCRMEPNVGPRFDFAIQTPEDLSKLNLVPNVDDALAYVFDAVYWTRQRVQNKVPVIGFSGAPWTLLGYMIEGGASRTFDNAKKWLYLYPEASRKVLAALREIIIEYLVGQFDSGAPLLTIFDTNCGELPPAMYEEFCVADLKYIAEEVKRRRPEALMTVFPKDGELQTWDSSAYDVVGVSWTKSPEQARRECPSKTLQGNLDPHLLYADPEVITATTKRMVREFGFEKYIANGGHGMMPSHPPEGLKAFIDGVDTARRA